MKWEAIDWDALERLRTTFLTGTARDEDYWRSERDLESYDQTFAQRIAWKWDYVLNELKRRDWSPPAGELLDWGCGTGIASRRFLKHFPAAPISALALWDRSTLAMEFAADETRRVFPQVTVRTGLPVNHEMGALVISHVLSELPERQLDELIALANRATSVVWVEPGTFEISRALIAVRERLREPFHVVAPCTHQAACGMLIPENERHWCHHFAPSPPEVFTDGNWVRFGKIAGVDLRSLPLSFLVLDKRPQPSLPAGVARIIGRPRVYKAHALVLGCDESGVRERRLTKRAVPEEFRRLKKDKFDPLQIWKCVDDEVVDVRPFCK